MAFNLDLVVLPLMAVLAWFVNVTFATMSEILFLREMISRKMVTPEKQAKKDSYKFRLFEFTKVVPVRTNKHELPHARSGHRVVCNANYLYSYGGFNPRYLEDEGFLPCDHLFNELWQFNFVSRRWTLYPKQETIPPELASAATCYDGITLVVYGGTSVPFGEQCSNQVYITQPLNSTDYTGMHLLPTTGEIPPPMYGQALIFHKGYLYAIGGTTGYEYTCDIHRLDVKTCVWDVVYMDSGGLEYSPQGRYRHEVAFDGCRIYILGGGTSTQTFDFEYIPTFNLTERVWEKVQTVRDPRRADRHGFPEPRMCHTCVQHRSTDDQWFVFMIGGSNGPKVYNEMWRLDLRTLQWACVRNKPLPYPVYFNSGAITPQGKMYIFGGINRLNFDRTNTVHSAWVTIPKLTEMCWEAMLFHCPQIVERSKNSLLNAGVPVHFINRIDVE